MLKDHKGNTVKHLNLGLFSLALNEDTVRSASKRISIVRPGDVLSAKGSLSLPFSVYERHDSQVAVASFLSWKSHVTEA